MIACSPPTACKNTRPMYIFLVGQFSKKEPKKTKNKGRNDTNNGLFRKLYVCQGFCTLSRKLHIVKTVVRKLCQSCE